ncbi:hypothetical protein OPS25_13765 [Alteromonas ponticola]|uniref:EF-hand domain-containing protein n=1 Tax=Alteromonas aquimaris TaxID=2998417 RepID=A0ABT3P9W1_9ALTE|nr:hypothetical protein [Alteromonas aquimaris]MCW8109571.1 hypothetical protein [Alteromonas aquimaris]
MKSFTLTSLSMAALAFGVVAADDKLSTGKNDSTVLSPKSDYEAVLDKYDINRNGELDKTELARYFEANQGKDVAASDAPKGDKITVTQKPAQVTVNQKPAQITVRQPKPEVTISTQDPDITIDQPEPEVEVTQTEPRVKVKPGKPAVDVAQEQPKVDIDQPDPEVEVEEADMEVAVNKKR